MAESNTRRTKKVKKKGQVAINLSNCKYEVVRSVQNKLGWLEVGDEADWHLYWTDTSIGAERLMRLAKYQKINHFFGMLEICRKKSLARNLGKMRKLFAGDYNFAPKTFILPAQLPQLLSQFNSSKQKTFILKPDNGCQGRGIVLAQTAEEITKAVDNFPGGNIVAQKYLLKPLLIDGFKFDLRVYVLVLSADPLKVFIYKEGLARFCTEKYVTPSKQNLDSACMHLTNYAVNKHNENFEFNKSAENMEEGSKWSLSALLGALSAAGHDTVKLWQQIAEMAVKTLISVQPLLVHNYRTCTDNISVGSACFELLGLDIILDHKCKPWLLEVNHSPSFAVETPLDLSIKEALIMNTLQLMKLDLKAIRRCKENESKQAKKRLIKNLSKKENAAVEVKGECAKADALTALERHEAKFMGNFECIYPPENPALGAHYTELLQGAAKCFEGHFEVKVREGLARVSEERKRIQAEIEQELLKKAAKRTLKASRQPSQPPPRIREPLRVPKLLPNAMEHDSEKSRKSEDNTEKIEESSENVNIRYSVEISAGTSRDSDGQAGEPSSARTSRGSDRQAGGPSSIGTSRGSASPGKEPLVIPRIDVRNSSGGSVKVQNVTLGSFSGRKETEKCVKLGSLGDLKELKGRGVEEKRILDERAGSRQRVLDLSLLTMHGLTMVAPLPSRGKPGHVSRHRWSN